MTGGAGRRSCRTSAFPASYNLARSLLRRRREVGDGGQGRLLLSRPRLDLRRGGGAGRGRRRCPGGAGRAPRGARAHRPARLGRVRRHVPGHVAARRRRRAVQHVSRPGRLPVLPGREPRARCWSRRPRSPTPWPRPLPRPPTCRPCSCTDAREDADLTRAWPRWVDAALADVRGRPNTHRDAPAFWLWTSGSTGRAQSRRAPAPGLAVVLRGLRRRRAGAHARDRLFSAAKLFHAYGSGNSLAFPFWVGATAALLPARATPDAVFDVMRRHRPTVFFGVPTLYAALVQRAPARHRDGPGVAAPGRVGRRAAARRPLSPLARRCSTPSCSTPSAPPKCCTAICRPARAGARRAASASRCLAMRCGSSTSGATTSPAGGIGELLVHGQSTALGLLAAARADGREDARAVVPSGDQISRDADGYYWHIGRSRRHVQGVGRVVLGHRGRGGAGRTPAVLECAVVPKPTRRRAQAARRRRDRRRARPRTRHWPTSSASFVRARLARYKVPRTIEFVSELPKTATGKIQRFKLRA